MAVDGATLTRINELLLDFIMPALRQQFPDINILFRRITRTSQHVVGREVVLGLHYGRARAGGARHDSEALPKADYQRVKRTSFTIPGNYWPIEITEQSIAAGRTSRGAFADALAMELERAFEDMKADLNRQLYGMGEGVVARWRSGDDPTAGVGYTLESRYTAGGFGCTFGSKYIEDDAVVNVVDRGTTATVYPTTSTADGYTCSSVDKTNHTVVLDGDPGITETANDYLTKAGSYADGIGTSSFKPREMMGLAGIVHDDDVDTLITAGATSHPLQGLDVATYPWWKAKVFASSGGRWTGQRSLTEEMIQRAIDYLREMQGVSPTIMITTSGVWRSFAYGEISEGRRFLDTTEVVAGIRVPSFLGLPVIQDPDMHPGELYLLTEPHLTIHQMNELSWLDQDGTILRAKAGYPAWTACLCWFAQLATDRRNAHALIADLEYDTY